MLALLDLFSPIPVYIFACSIADLLGVVTFNTAFCALAVQFTNISSWYFMCMFFELEISFVFIYYLLLILLEISL